MEKIELKLKDARNALKTLKDIINESFSIIVRDATIQRFEYTFEAFWKFLQEYLKNKEGIVVNSPKAVFRETFSLGFCSEDEAVRLLDMTDRRNETSHTYKDKLAKTIYEKVVKDYLPLMIKILPRFAKKI